MVLLPIWNPLVEDRGTPINPRETSRTSPIGRTDLTDRADLTVATSPLPMLAWTAMAVAQAETAGTAVILIALQSLFFLKCRNRAAVLQMICYGWKCSLQWLGRKRIETMFQLARPRRLVAASEVHREQTEQAGNR